MKIIDKHAKAEELRESEKFFEALRMYDEVIVGYGKEKNYKKLVEVLQGKVLTYKHLYLRTKRKIYYNLGKKFAKTSLSVAKKHRIVDMYASCYFRLGEMEMEAENMSEAEKYFGKTIEKQDKNEAVWGDYIYHLGQIMCDLGKKKEGLRKMRQGMKHIDKFEDKMNDYVFKVWKSGVLMKISKIDEKRRDEYMEKVKKIVYGDKRLVIRRRQFEDLSREMKMPNKDRR